jgi:uncharacterized Zn finger protein
MTHTAFSNKAETTLTTRQPIKCGSCGSSDFVLICPKNPDINWTFMCITDEDETTLAAIDLWECAQCGTVQMTARKRETENATGS